MVSDVTWQSVDDYESLEKQFGDDIDGNNLISANDTYQPIGEKNVILKPTKV